MTIHLNYKPISAGLIALLSLMLGACSSTPVQTPAAPTPEAVSPAPAPSDPAPSPAAVTPPAATVAAHLDPSSAIFRERSVYFDFDDAVITPQWQQVIERQGQYLAKNSSLSVRVEGNADERGGREYNLALGQRRAEAVKKALLVFGVKESQIETVSFGEERPKANSNDEAAWSQNRRADFVYK